MGKRMSLDQALLWKMRGELDPRTYRENLIVTLGFAVWVAVLVVSRPIPATWTLAPGLLLTVTMLFHLWLHWRAYCRRDRIYSLVEQMPHRLQNDAHVAYGFGIDAYLSVWECHEAHMPGECPLCGAT